MKNDYSILLLGEFYNGHMERFVKNLKDKNPNAQIDCFTPFLKGYDVSNDYLDCFRECEMAHFSSLFRHVPILNYRETIYNWKKEFRKFIKNKQYNIVNIHYPRSVYSYILPELRRAAEKIVLTPWGSDVLRISEKDRERVRILYDASDYVTGYKGRFTEEFMKIYSIPQEKLVFAFIGSDVIDYIVEHKRIIDAKEAKKRLGIENSYVISCGYNASMAQRHHQMIEAVEKAKKHLPDNIVLLFPVTYPKNPHYIKQLKSMTEGLGLKTLFFDHYLDLYSLFILRQATDMFIHVQTTDATNASLKEYLLLEKNCINGAWLYYPDLEKDNDKPYYTVQSVDSLDKVIIEAYLKGPKRINEDVLECITSVGCKPAAERWNDFFMSISQ